MKKSFLTISSISFFLFPGLITQAQKVLQLDSANYRNWLIEDYTKKTTGDTSYKYHSLSYSKAQQDSLWLQAVTWKKSYYEYPMILHYLNLKQGTPEATAKVQYLEDPAKEKERQLLLAKAHELYLREHSGKGAKESRHVAPGLSTSTTPGKVENHDKEIKEKILKNWKF